MYLLSRTRAAQRPGGKRLTLISTEAFKPHDDYLLEFDPEQPTEYLYWQEGTMPASLSMVHMYWHAHHAWTSLIVDGEPVTVDLLHAPGEFYADGTDASCRVPIAMSETRAHASGERQVSPALASGSAHAD